MENYCLIAGGMALHAIWSTLAHGRALVFCGFVRESYVLWDLSILPRDESSHVIGELISYIS